MSSILQRLGRSRPGASRAGWWCHVEAPRWWSPRLAAAAYLCPHPRRAPFGWSATAPGRSATMWLARVQFSRSGANLRMPGRPADPSFSSSLRAGSGSTTFLQMPPTVTLVVDYECGGCPRAAGPGSEGVERVWLLWNETQTVLRVELRFFGYNVSHLAML